MHQAIEKIRGGLVVSCQAYPGEPLRHPETMAQMAMAAVEGGAVGIRCQGLADIAAIKGQVSVPVIGACPSVAVAGSVKASAAVSSSFTTSEVTRPM